MPLYFDSTMIYLLPALLLAGLAQMKISSTFAKYKKVAGSRGFTGAQVAQAILNRQGLSSVQVLPVAGELTDHYNPADKVVSLSQAVYNKTSVAAMAVAAHEVGHAIQDQEAYIPLRFRNTMVPLVNFSSNMVWILFILGMVLAKNNLIQAAILLFTVTVIFSILTLPVEFNASKRALAQLSDSGLMNQQELDQAREVLTAAALTYVAATLMAISQLIRLLALSNRRSNN